MGVANRKETDLHLWDVYIIDTIIEHVIHTTNNNYEQETRDTCRLETIQVLNIKLNNYLSLPNL